MADFQQFYGIRLQDVVTGDRSPREVIVLIDQLPEQARFHAVRQPGGRDNYGWTVDRYLLVAISNAITNLTYAYVSANSKRKPKKPKLIETPYDRQRKAVQKEHNAFAAQVNAQLQALKAKE